MKWKDKNREKINKKRREWYWKHGGKEAMKNYMRKYSQSKKGKETIKRYHCSKKYKNYVKRYQQTEKFKKAHRIARMNYYYRTGK